MEAGRMGDEYWALDDSGLEERLNQFQSSPTSLIQIGDIELRPALSEECIDEGVTRMSMIADEEGAMTEPDTLWPVDSVLKTLSETSAKIQKETQCSECHRVFKRRYEMKRHMSGTHLNVRPFRCMDCGRRFVRKCHLETHRKGFRTCISGRSSKRKDTTQPHTNTT